MEITEYNIQEAIQALRQCAAEHESEHVCTGAVVTKDICRDVAAYLEKRVQRIKKLEKVVKARGDVEVLEKLLNECVNVLAEAMKFKRIKAGEQVGRTGIKRNTPKLLWFIARLYFALDLFLVSLEPDWDSIFYKPDVFHKVKDMAQDSLECAVRYVDDEKQYTDGEAHRGTQHW
nr:MAG TPA: hypothetical protein [Caudoviricetes sp.]